MQRDANRLLVESGADFAMFPNYIAPLNVVCPFVNVVHDLAIIRMPEFFNLGKLASQRPLLPLIVRRAAAVGTVSAASRRDIVELLGVPEHRVLMLPGAPHPACRVPLPAEVERVRRAYGLAAPLHRVGGNAGAAQEPADAVAGVRSLARAGGDGGSGSGRHRRARVA